MRNRGVGGYIPSSDEVFIARGTLTQSQAAKLVHTTDRVWRFWESGQTRMSPSVWELFNIKKKLQKE